MMRRALEVPSFTNMRDNIRIPYHYRRGDYVTAVRYGEQFIAAHPPFSLIGWAPPTRKSRSPI